jgi:hypothetical protein
VPLHDLRGYCNYFCHLVSLALSACPRAAPVLTHRFIAFLQAVISNITLGPALSFIQLNLGAEVAIPARVRRVNFFAWFLRQTLEFACDSQNILV